MAAVKQLPHPGENLSSHDKFFQVLGQEYIRVWEEMHQRKAPSKLMPAFLGFFLWHNVILPANEQVA